MPETERTYRYLIGTSDNLTALVAFIVVVLWIARGCGHI